MKRITLFATLFATISVLPLSAQKKYTNPVYGSDFPDPTVQRALDGTFYAYATGCKCKKSSDLVTWTDVSGVISRPTWNDSTYVDADGKKKTDYYSLWAADVNYVDGKYICYYASALWGNGSRTGIGVAVGDSPTKFTDKGKLFRSTEIGVKNSIDPCYVEEFDKKYIVWGSFNDICIAELTDNALAIKDFNPINNPQPNGSWKRHKGVTKLAGGAFEGAMIYKRGKYYYLFASVGSCCEGENSSYRTVVGRAEKLMGPYVNKQGGQMVSDNYTTIIEGNSGTSGRWKGPGHNSEIITDDEGQTWFLYHSYDRNNSFNGRLMLLDKITWVNDWPVVNNGHPSSDEQDAPIFYTGNGANVTYKVVNADLMKSGWKGWNVTASENCEIASGRGTAFAPFGYAKYGGTFDISQTISASVQDGLYEMKVNGFDSEHSVEYYVGNVATPVICPADNGSSSPSSDAVVSNNFLNGRFSQSVYGLAVNKELTFGMRTKQPLSDTERFCVSNVNIIYRDKLADSDPTALASVLGSYYAMANDLAEGGKPYYNGYNQTIAFYKETAEASGADAKTRYQQLLKIHRTIDSIRTSIDVYATLVVEVKKLQEKLVVADAGGFSTQEARDALAEAQQVLADCNLKDRDVKTLVALLQSVIRDMMYSYQEGDGTKDNPYLITRPDQLDHMHDVLIKDQMVYFVLGADVDMEGYDWKQLNASSNSYRYWINFDGQGHIIRNLTPVSSESYPSFFGTMCGEIRNTGFVDAKINSTGSGAAVIGGTLGHSSFKDSEDNLYPVIIENCYVTGSITSKGYVGAIGGTLGSSPIIIRNCYSAVAIVGSGTNYNYSGGLVGRVRTNLTLENCYAAAPVSSPIAGGIVAGGQNSSTPASTYTNVIAWNPSVESNTPTGTADPFGFTTELDVLSGIYTFADMLLNGMPVREGLSHMELCEIAGKWGEPWYKTPTAGNGYPILQWQYDRGDYRDICGFDPDDDPVGIQAVQSSTPKVQDPVFNLAGQRLKKVQKGINIVGGKKVLY